MDSIGLEDLDLVPRVGKGRQTVPLEIEFERELTRADLAMPAPPTAKTPSIKAIRDSHHGLARVLATGVGESEASAVTGYSLSRISILKADPQFRELLEFYREKTDEVTVDFARRMAEVGADALSILRERLEDDPDSVSVGTLREIVRDLADRTGHAPQRGPSTAVQVNIGLAEQMEAARNRVKAIQGTAVRAK